MKLFQWLKENKLVAVLSLIIFFLLLKNSNLLFSLSPRVSQPNYQYPMVDEAEEAPLAGSQLMKESVIPPSQPTTPYPEQKTRMVVESSNISLVVDQVQAKVDQVLDYVKEKKGYMVSSSINQLQEAPFAQLVVRLPREELRPALKYLRQIAVKVTSENLKGRDVTDQYLDLQARLKTFEKTKAKYEKILDQATTVEEILKVERQIINLQEQIDQLKGREQYLEKTAENAKLTVYLSTDELSLPYTPEEPAFRPKVIFKKAVRSLVKSLRGLAKIIIWLAVYSLIWVPLLLVFYWLKKRKK